MLQGRVKWFDEVRGYGFLENEYGDDFFVSCEAIRIRDLMVLQKGRAVIFEVRRDKIGVSARNVSVI